MTGKLGPAQKEKGAAGTRESISVRRCERCGGGGGVGGGGGGRE
jgi:hypothetical protein